LGRIAGTVSPWSVRVGHGRATRVRGDELAADLEEFVERYHRSVAAFIAGDPSPQEQIWSRRADVTLANPLGPPALGWNEVSDALRRAVSQLSDGEVLAVDRISSYSSGDLAYIVEIEHDRVRLGGAREPATLALRVTTIFRREEDGWKVLHRHADPITTSRPVDSMVQE
jgi:ketosteroid isomerase-like protein